MIIYGLDTEIQFPITEYYRKYRKKTLGFYLDKRGEKEEILTARIKNVVSNLKKKFPIIDYIDKQFSNIDKDIFPIDKSLFYEIGKAIMDIHVLWQSNSTEDSFYDARYQIVQNVKKLENEVDNRYEKIIESRKEIALQFHKNCLHGQRIKLMKIDMCLPIFEGYRELVYRFRRPNESKKETNTRISFSEKLLEIVELLKSVKHQDDEVFLNLSEETQDYYRKWHVYFNRPDEDSLEARQKYLEAVKVIAKVTKSEVEKYNQYLQDAEEEKQQIIAEVNQEKEKEIQAEIENQQREAQMKKEEEIRNKQYEADLNSQLLIIESELDRQFQEAQSALQSQHEKEISELQKQQPQIGQTFAVANVEVKQLPQNNLDDVYLQSSAIVPVETSRHYQVTQNSFVSPQSERDKSLFIIVLESMGKILRGEA